ncbi:MAG: hypothetical protein J7M08_00295 [Planctomycetes bacterium]|nr:hypothetical protein [Planctomycetota bacterium]
MDYWDALKSYDIRSTYPAPINRGFAYRLGLCLPQALSAHRVAIGRDARLSSPELYTAFASGLRAAGADPVGMGLCPTEFVYYAMGAHAELDLGVMITASHNPPEYNGFKVTLPGGEPVTGQSGLHETIRMMQDVALDSLPELLPLETALDVRADYLQFALELAGRPAVGDLEIVVDAGNGVGGMLWELIADGLGLDAVKLNFEPDGRFPAHHPDPSRIENLRSLVEQVRARPGALGFAYDGDADRVAVVLDGRHVVGGSAMTAVVAHRMLADAPGRAFAVGQTMSRSVLDYFRSRGPDPMMLPVGHAKIKKALRANPDIALAGEDAGHYYYQDFFCCDSALITTLNILHLAGAGELGDFLASLAGPWYRPEATSSIGFDDMTRALEVCRQVALRALEEYPAVLEITCERQGSITRRCDPSQIGDALAVRADYPDWWFCVRPSGTEPLARLLVEARTRELARERTEFLLALFDACR